MQDGGHVAIVLSKELADLGGRPHHDLHAASLRLFEHCGQYGQLSRHTSADEEAGRRPRDGLVKRERRMTELLPMGL